MAALQRKGGYGTHKTCRGQRGITPASSQSQQEYMYSQTYPARWYQTNEQKTSKASTIHCRHYIYTHVKTPSSANLRRLGSLIQRGFFPLFLTQCVTRFTTPVFHRKHTCWTQPNCASDRSYHVSLSPAFSLSLSLSLSHTHTHTHTHKHTQTQ